MNPQAAYRAEREALLARIVGLLEADKRVTAAWLFGSLGRGDADELFFF
jgi:predicted nucleotidyltransferase